MNSPTELAYYEHYRTEHVITENKIVHYLGIKDLREEVLRSELSGLECPV